MENEIIKRLLETNEKARQEADKKFRIVAALLLLSLLGNIYQATMTSEVVIDSNSSFQQSDYNVNEIKGK